MMIVKRRREIFRRNGRERMKAFIWDLDGTILDSYEVITSSAIDALKEQGIAADPEELLRYMKNVSLTSYLRDASASSGIPFETLMSRYTEITHGRDDRITLTEQAAETLRGLRKAGGVNYVYTHRGHSTFEILERLGILEEFADFVTHEDKVRPKPSGDGLRELIRRHGLDPKETCYIGDRPMDILCARDAGVTAVLYRPAGGYTAPTGQEDLIVAELSEIMTLLDRSFRHPCSAAPQ